MRYIPAFCLREGMVLAKDLYGANGTLLLRSGQGLDQHHITHIARLGFQGVYISDNLSEEIEIENVVSDELRVSAEKTISAVFTESRTGTISRETTARAADTVQRITGEIIGNKDLMVNMIDLKTYDNYTYRHSVNVGILSIVLGVALNLNRPHLYKLGLSAMLHDIGKVFIDRDIIEKKARLTLEEFQEVKKHPALGYRYLQKTDYDLPPMSLTGVLQHHERVDGSGYPYGLTENDISMFGRIISIADVFDAMTSDRPYRAAMMPSEVMEYLMGGAGTLFDADYVYLFTRKVAAFPLGTCVLLSNGLTAIVTENYADCCLRPKVKIICDDTAVPATYYDLKNDRSLTGVTIVRVIEM